MALEDDMALLSRVALFRDMDRDALRLLAFSSEMRNLRTGDTLFRKDDLSEYSFVVATGSVALIDNDFVLAVIGPGGLIGEMALFTETRRPATAVAREATTLLRLSRQIFRRTLEEYPDNALRVAAVLRARVKRISVELAEVRGRLLRIDKKP
ncbi:cyclic nucleotide-binding domain-containing protein [Labrys monachus]|uniref:CRP-like cAMP-binding protein n=1 Tax=Labrys monachus TaxID=217067 RepID=A0ABU0FDM5_9HYPH|nr:cyclic nucleotide-binding domain-containing protein [Labrys monachus]MDQ0392432.1 CRP-like cAMP-binding protein [Labrys monachus]